MQERIEAQGQHHYSYHARTVVLAIPVASYAQPQAFTHSNTSTPQRGNYRERLPMEKFPARFQKLGNDFFATLPQRDQRDTLMEYVYSHGRILRDPSFSLQPYLLQGKDKPTLLGLLLKKTSKTPGTLTALEALIDTICKKTKIRSIAVAPTTLEGYDHLTHLLSNATKHKDTNSGLEEPFAKRQKITHRTSQLSSNNNNQNVSSEITEALIALSGSTTAIIPLAAQDTAAAIKAKPKPISPCTSLLNLGIFPPKPDTALSSSITNQPPSSCGIP